MLLAMLGKPSGRSTMQYLKADLASMLLGFCAVAMAFHVSKGNLSFMNGREILLQLESRDLFPIFDLEDPTDLRFQAHIVVRGFRSMLTR
jgi:hypothetical protein